MISEYTEIFLKVQNIAHVEKWMGRGEGMIR